MIENDKLENYIFIRHKLFLINRSEDPDIAMSHLIEWTKSSLNLDFGKEARKNVRVVKNPKELSEELKNYYITFLEAKVYKWHQLIE